MCPPSDQHQPAHPAGTAREEIAAWIQEHDLRTKHVGMVSADPVERFLAIARDAGFELSFSKVESNAGSQLLGQWTHHGHTFVGFKQPESAPDPENARVLACAALLRNDWCRSRLP